MQALDKTATNVAILYPGDLGLHLGKLLHEQGHRLLTTVTGRSARTRRRAEEANFDILPALEDVLEQSDIVLSLVPPAAALANAERCAAIDTGRGRIFVDLNSIAPETATRIARLFSRSQTGFVDGAVHGMAAQLETRGTLYLSGARASDVARLFGTALRIKVLSDKPGAASAFKMMIAGLNKGVVALVLEMTLAARQEGFLDDLLGCYRDAYPGIMTLVDRLLPTYPEHAKRRGDELKEVAQTMRSWGIEPCLVEAARRLTAAVGGLNLRDDERTWSVPEVIEEIFTQNPLRRVQPEASLPRFDALAAVARNT